MKMRLTTTTLVTVLSATVAQGALVTPQYDTFGSLPGATFGGSGIPNNAVAITTINDGANTITIGLAAFQRYNNPALANNGAGVFTATAGANYGTPATPNTPNTPSTSLGATWNLGWYIDIAGGGTLANYGFQLLYDLDAGVGTQDTAHGKLTELALFSPITATTSHSEDSQNLLFAFWGQNIPGYVEPPAGAFNPYIAGEYTLSLQVFDSAGNTLLGASAIQVNVNAVPEPSTYLAGALLLLPFGVNTLRKFRNNRQA